MDSHRHIFLTFLRFGCLAWGGPVAQIAMIRDELVERRQWVTPDKFKRALAVYQALPGPEAHELCVYLGMVRGGRLGGFLAGLGFMLPGLLLMVLLSWAYLHYGAAALLPLFVGVAPAVAALIVRATHRIGGHVAHTPPLLLASAAAFGLSFAGMHFVPILLLCAAWHVLWQKGRRKTAGLVLAIAAGALLLGRMFFMDTEIAVAHAAGNLFAEGLKAGMLSFGGAYTVIPFLEHSMVGVYPQVTPQAFLDGIALSSVIPAPLVIFGTFLGYMAGRVAGALLVTAGIFLPAFAFTLLGHRWLEKLMENPTLHGALDGIAAGVAGLLAATAVMIMLQTLTGLVPWVIFAAALAALYRLKQKWAIPAVVMTAGVVGYFLTVTLQ